MNTFTIKEKKGETEYMFDANGAIRQMYPKKFTYGPKYSATYDKPEYERKAAALNSIRYGIVQAVHDGPIDRLLDVGYGNGSFLRHVRSANHHVDLYGHDVADTDIPDGCNKAESLTPYGVDVITFWDALEHFHDLSFLSILGAKTIVLSLPWCPLTPPMAEFMECIDNFADWKHRKPDEHIYHFDKYALKATMNMYGWRMIAAGNPEDVIRKNGTKKNILTAAFKRK